MERKIFFKKILLFFLSALFLLYLLPLCVIHLSNDSVMGIAFILFFALYPFSSAVIGYLSFHSLKYFWWMPLAFALLFPPLFSLAILDAVFDLYIYSAGYAVIGYCATLLAYLINNIKQRIKK